MKDKIAIIDDNSSSAKSLAEFFKSRNVTPTIFTSCEELLASDTNFDVVITDTDLGDGMSGFDCAKNIRERMPHAFIVGTTVVEPERNEEYRTIYLRSGANTFVNRRESGTIVEQVQQFLSEG